jgi:hypothetical protein
MIACVPVPGKVSGFERCRLVSHDWKNVVFGELELLVHVRSPDKPGVFRIDKDSSHHSRRLA